MKHLMLAIIVFTNAGSVIAQNSKLDTLVNARWNGTAWQNHSRTINSYDADCRLKTALTQNWDVTAGKWIDYSMGAYSYVSGNYTGEVVTQTWSDNTWTNSFRQTYTYDASFKTLSIVAQTWSFDHWSNYLSTGYAYDKNGYADSVWVQSSNADGPFENDKLTIYTNNSDGSNSQVITQNWNTNTASWYNYSKSSFAYNSHKAVDTAISFLWNYSSSSWQLYTQSVYTYNSKGKIYYYVTQGWQTNQWVNQSLYTNSYDNYGLVSNILLQRWDGFDWEKYNQDTYINNSDGSLHQHVAEYWNEAINTWVNDSRETYFYSSTCLLPLQLLLFTASKNNNEIHLNWQAADEINCSRFTVQRSFNAVDFTSLGDIQVKTGTGIHSYGFTDAIEKITADNIYYRLKMIDKDGSYTYSNLVAVAILAYTGILKVYPDPAHDQLFVVFQIQNTSKTQLQVTNILGKVLYSTTLPANQATGIAGVTISSFSNGVYYVLLINGTTIQRAKFVKQ